MSITGLSHVAVAVRSLAEQVPYYRDTLGLELIGEEIVADQKVRIMIFRAGQTRIELLEPTSDDSPVAKFMKKRGEGIHHIAYSVEDLPQVLERVRAQGVDLIDEEPKRGADGKEIAFLHPKSTFGVLTEFCAEPRQ